MTVNRSAKNPIVTPESVEPFLEHYEVIGVFNAGVAIYQGETILLLRVAERPLCENQRQVAAPIYNVEKNAVELLYFDKNDGRCDFSDPRMIYVNEQGGRKTYLTSLSYLRIARSSDGENFTTQPKPFIFPFNQYMTYGIEDPRITQIEDTYYITFSAVSPLGIVAAMVSTKDFVSYVDEGNILHADNKDVAIFPEKIGGKYYALHRPSTSVFGKPEMWIASSPDLRNWGRHSFLAGLRAGMWDSQRMGAGAVPFKTPYGWLEIYHGATADNRYCLGAMLLSLDEPSKIIARSEMPMVVPEASYECEGFFGDVVFACGAVIKNDRVKIYYGASDENMAMLSIAILDILQHLGISDTNRAKALEGGG